MGWQIEKPANLEEKALQFAPKVLTREVIMWGGGIRENEFLIFWLVYLEVAISLRMMRPTSSDARLGGGWMSSCKPLYLPFQKPFEEC